MIGRTGNTTQCKWYSYLLFQRKNEYNFILRGCRLLREFVVDLYICIERSRLNFIRINQPRLKVNLYQGVLEALDNDLDLNGSHIVLPSSLIGGPREMSQLFQDSMSLVREFGHPSLFITMTANPHWPEIVEQLVPGKTSADRPDIVTQVFYLKLQSMMRDLTKKNCLWKVVSYVYTVELQKQGLPHAHILLILDREYVPNTAHKADKLILAELPNPQKCPNLYKLVTRNMLHGPFSARFACWRNDKCKYGFPKPFSEHTMLVDGEYPI
ncbi:hypothetical protein O181_066568 [Austropuccinia psidii MF-1]|uniref:Helitron helicase-like domain-containing protein n=1 Tax=Austropuccinia psidii MF-1 TaxID=1389203 RepID=A0A9Q3I3Q5_9BASI|nr:hypothetical protein [Austropuccinia psidii MF-1]